MDPNGGLQTPIGKELQEGWTMAEMIGRSPLGRLSGWDPGPSSSTTTSLVWAESIQQHHTRQCWMKSHTVNMGQGAQRVLCGNKKWRDPTTLSFHQHVPMTCWTITICPRSCSTGKIYVASAHVPPNCRVVQKTVRRKGTSSKQEPIWNGTHHLSDWFSIIHLWSIHWSS